MNQIAGAIVVLAGTVSLTGAAVGHEDPLYFLGVLLLLVGALIMFPPLRRKDKNEG